MSILWKWIGTVGVFGGWMLIAPGGVWGQHFEKCIDNIDNATVVIPTSVQADVGGGSLETGDEIALFTDDGVCAGRSVWDEENLSIAAAGVGSMAAEAEDQTPSGFQSREPLKYRIWDASAKQVYTAEVTYEPCEGTESLCADDGSYTNDRLFSVATLHTVSEVSAELTAFDVHTEGAETVLTWQTAAERNNAGFEVQYQGPFTSEGEWARAGFVEGHGTSSKTKHYSYRLKKLSPGEHRFRLKQVDVEGASEYSGVVEAVVAVTGTHDVVSPYPNPFRQRATFAVTVAEAQRVDITAYNQLGQRVAHLHDGRLKPNRPHMFRLDGRRLSSGLYFIRIQGEQFSATQRAILVR